MVSSFYHRSASFIPPEKKSLTLILTGYYSLHNKVLVLYSFISNNPYIFKLLQSFERKLGNQKRSSLKTVGSVFLLGCLHPFILLRPDGRQPAVGFGPVGDVVRSQVISEETTKYSQDGPSSVCMLPFQ